MPYKNEHACRLRQPKEFKKGSFRRKVSGKVSLIIGKLKGQRKTTLQAIRYNIKKWSVEAAENDCMKKGGIFTAAKGYDPLKKRSGLIANPQVKGFHDYGALGTVRILHRKNAVSFPELALTAEHKGNYMAEIGEALSNAGFTDELQGKWVLRTNKFNIFVYV